MIPQPIVIVTSFNRPAYLKACLESLKRSDCFIGVVDGGSTTDGIAEALDLADDFLIVPNNPGADVLKNEGILRWVLGYPNGRRLHHKVNLPSVFPIPDDFIVTSDDFIFPVSWLNQLIFQWRAIRAAGAKLGIRYGMMACPTDLVIERHTFPEGGGPNRRGCGYHYQKAPGCPEIEIMPTSVTMVAGTIMDTLAVHQCNGFPVYGRTGQGDIAISIELRARNWERGYFKEPVLRHLGQAKYEDYPDYSAAFEADDDIWQGLARAHKLGSREGFSWPCDRPGTWLP